MGEARDFKFGVLIDRQARKPKIAKVDHNGRSLRNVTYFCNFGTPSISPERLKIGTSNLVNLVCTLPPDLQTKKWKSGSEGRDLRHVTYFYNFGTPCISLEWVKLETSNLVCWLTARPISQKVQNKVKRGVAYVTWHIFIILGPPCISLERVKLDQLDLLV